MMRFQLFALAIISLVISACSPSPAPGQAQHASPEALVGVEATGTSEPTAPPATSATPTPLPAFDAITYRDEAAGFEFDYPVGWTNGGGEGQSRGSYVQFYSWNWQPGESIDPLPADGTVLTVTNQLWDPKNDLEAFINQRKIAWEASGISIQSDEHLTLAGDRTATEFTVQGMDGAQAYFLLTTNGENYLVFSGNGDLNQLADIAHTLRPIP